MDECLSLVYMLYACMVYTLFTVFVHVHAYVYRLHQRRAIQE